jgi:hypothetical protein
MAKIGLELRGGDFYNGRASGRNSEGFLIPIFIGTG